MFPKFKNFSTNFWSWNPFFTKLTIAWIILVIYFFKNELIKSSKHIKKSCQQDGLGIFLNEGPVSVFFSTYFLKSCFIIERSVFWTKAEVLYLANLKQSARPSNNVTITTSTKNTATTTPNISNKRNVKAVTKLLHKNEYYLFW